MKIFDIICFIGLSLIAIGFLISGLIQKEIIEIILGVMLLASIGYFLFSRDGNKGVKK